VTRAQHTRFTEIDFTVAHILTASFSLQAFLEHHQLSARKSFTTPLATS
jgi:hypothetical protein